MFWVCLVFCLWGFLLVYFCFAFVKLTGRFRNNALMEAVSFSILGSLWKEKSQSLYFKMKYKVASGHRQQTVLIRFLGQADSLVH